MPKLLEAKHISRAINGSWIWRGVSLAVDQGDRLGLVGPSGAGKSLLLRALAGLDQVQEGEILCRGEHLERWFMPEYRTRVVYLHQRPSLGEGSVEDNLRIVFGFAVHKHRSFERGKVASFFRTLGRPSSFLAREAHSLSGGEAQMVALVRALQIEPDVLLLDEPTASLDAQSKAGIETLLAKWQEADEGRAYLLTSHNREQIARLCRETVTL
jgi:putative ABC transport system ATP-binding protein